MSGIAVLPVIDRDEAHFAQASRQMVQTGNYFQIRFQEKTRFQKPPGINWLQAASVKLFSNAEASAIWPYRIPSVLAALISILLTYFLARKFDNAKTARLSAALLASTLLLVVETHMAVIDASLLTTVLLMQIALWIIYRNAFEKVQTHWIWPLCFWLAMSLGFVLKGVTPLVGFLTIVALCLLEKRINWLRRLHVFSGLALFILLNLAWILMVNDAENSNYLMQMIHKDLIPKLHGGHESHGKPPLFHLLILAVTFWPASLFFWQGARYAIEKRHEKEVKFLLAWILPTWFFFEFMPTKLPQYVLPTFPAIALLCAMGISKFTEAELPSKLLRFLQVLWSLISIGLALSLLSLPYLLMHRWSMVALIISVLITGLSLVAVYFSWKGAYQRASLTIGLMAFISYPLIFSSLLPQLKPLWLTKDAAKLVDKSLISVDKPLLVVGFEEPSLVFNLDTKTVKFSNPDTAGQLIQDDSSRLALVEEKALQNWQQKGKNLSIVGSLKGFDYSKGSWLTLLLVKQNTSGDS
ncbi:MAG: glycosyltransferase family 39 protein [Tatlockia sp.]|nr:glycosyltransferase family 39 protein [Tatlockia sp.]